MKDHTFREKVHHIMQELDLKSNTKDKKSIEDLLVRMHEENLLPRDILNLSPEFITALYNHGCQLFQSGKYNHALGIFYFVQEIDGHSFRYNMAIAACYHYLKDYTGAIHYYRIAAYNDPANPLPHFHLYDCFIKIKNPLTALNEINAVAYLTNKKPKYTALHEKASLELNSLKEDLKKNHPLNQIKEQKQVK